MAGKRGKKGKGLLIGIAVAVLALAGGGGFAAWKFLGKKPPVVKKTEGPKAVVKKVTPPAPEPPPHKPKPPAVVAKSPDVEAGASKLAKLWNEVETPKLLTITKPWKVKELAPVALKMDPGKVAEMLGQLDPKRASDLSREMKRLASVPEPEE